ncbi:MAG: thioesterase [Flavobacteriaceae bacterium CG_4_8_14_3_um_filter_34_10]|nr:thioesterase [Flavobacteriia bacterium]OIP51322.1 MAG: thioesterase [Flavobacteriaceae bacterium CG2_30_34_30]PIQ17860.1 MAG: thioesterase [Flavobacteriaceae bacterium CG18_big_fil_WC_8_21_14_2_50_34_36]PIV51263.1 MAG: thioesterase [Flavobacteriaceae bacterium CG02_land_8_20_14_3_00_34_13]PIX10409.1 MAG: thioesterase [Flavobacteriaceae bacterium CG_4_8_14_3_um_filter_34_10]PIZ07491.1 MAG: thioesterase [Flavobacteriaceae bacterium CG_4_10_14_0_8_um_filter_34_31]PJC07278.1 MAG: thioesterase 
MYMKEFEIRWSDIDANRHLANSAYINLMSHTRMGFFIENGIDQHEMAKYNISPVVFYEHVYYFKEVFVGKPVRVSLQLKGVSEDGMYFEFLHNFYDANGKNFASCEMMGAWIDLKERKLTGLPKELYANFSKLEHTDDFQLLTKEHTRRFGKKPKDLI